MTLPPELRAYQGAYDALPPAEQRQVDAALAKSERGLNSLIGAAMQATAGRANPHLVRQMLLTRLETALIEAAP